MVMKKIIAIVASIPMCLALSAQTMPSLIMDFDPSSLGVASSSVVTSSILDSKFDINASYGIWQPKMAKESLIGVNASYRFGEKFALGIYGRMFNQPSYEVVNEKGITSQVDGTFTPREMNFGLSGAFSISESFSAGITFKVANASLASDAKATAFGGDVFARFAKNGWKAGVAVCNIGSKADFGGGSSYALPSLVRAGGAYSVAGLTASAEFDYLFSGAIMAALGAEYWVKDIVAVRAGFHYGDKQKAIPTYASVGLGVKFFGVKLNATYLLASETLGNSLLFGLGYSF